MNDAMFVTGDYHIKRAELIFNKENDAVYEFSYIDTPNLSDDNWLDRENSCVY